MPARYVIFAHLLRRRRKGDAMKMSERNKQSMQTETPMTLISLRLPNNIIEDLSEVTPPLGIGGYQAAIDAYNSNGRRKHLSEREAQGGEDSAIEEFSQRLTVLGVPGQAIQNAVADVRAGS
jgi:hypothetical protein